MEYLGYLEYLEYNGIFGIFKNESNEICGRQPLKNFIWFILKYLHPSDIHIHIESKWLYLICNQPAYLF